MTWTVLQDFQPHAFTYLFPFFSFIGMICMCLQNTAGLKQICVCMYKYK
jgi:hypothetical protein